MAGKIYTVEKTDMPVIYPQGWKLAAAKACGLHPKSVCRILRDPKNPNYRRLIEAARSIYGSKS